MFDNTSNLTTQLIPQATIGPTNIVGAIFVGLLMLATLFGNFLVWASFISFRELRTKCNYFIISLAVADIMVALLAMPIWFILQLEPDIEKQTYLGHYTMLFWNWIDIFCGTASIMNLAAVSADRHLAITTPYSYHQFLTSFRAIMVICFAWTYATTISLFSIFLKNKIPNNGHQFLIVTASFFLPLTAMIIMYARIFAVARRQARMITKNLSYKTDIKAAKTIAVVIGAFVICWLPFFVLILGFAMDKKFLTDMRVYRGIKWMEYLNSCLNPIIYCCLNRTYRGAFKRLFERWRKSFMKKFFSKYSETEDDNLNHTFITRNHQSPTFMKKSFDSVESSKVTENGSTTKKQMLLLPTNGNYNNVPRQTEV